MSSARAKHRPRGTSEEDGYSNASVAVESRGSYSHTRRGRSYGNKKNQQQKPQKDQDVPSDPRGTCTSMCPDKERKEREAQRRLHRFELLKGTEKERVPKADPLRTVKEYSRPAAGKDSTQASDLRPPAVLLQTVCYLIDEVAASAVLQPWTEVYDFVFDRLRSVRQDMIIQRAGGPECLAVLERSVRFLIYASYRLRGESLRLYNPHINGTHLQECLSWLLDLHTTTPGKNREEFEALSLLHNLGSARAVQHALELPQRVRASPSVQLALAVNRAHAERNPVRLLRLATRLDFLQSCAVQRHLFACRRDLLLLYSHAYSSRSCRFPLQTLARLLLLTQSDTAQLCHSHGVELRGDDVFFSKTSVSEGQQRELHSHCLEQLVDIKQGDATLASVLHGCV